MEVRDLTGNDIDVGADVSTLAFDLEVGSWRADWQRQHEYCGPGVCWGVFEDGALVSSCISAPRRIWLGDIAIDGGFVGGVATHPDHRRQGYAEALMEGVVRAARERGILVNFLWPFSYRYYRKCGWDVASDMVTQVIDCSGFAAADDPPQEVSELKASEVPELMQLWSCYSARYNGLTDRTQRIWTDFMAGKRDPSPDEVLFNHPVHALICRESGRMSGYAKIGINEENNKVGVSEMAHVTPAAVRALLRAAHDLRPEAELTWAGPATAGVHILLDEPRNPARSTHAGCMARVLDAGAFLQAVKWPLEAAGKLTVEVHDPFLGAETVTVEIGSGSAVVASSSSPVRVTCTIQTFTQLVMGYLKPHEAVAIGRLNAGDLRAADLLAMASGGRAPFRSHDEPG